MISLKDILACERLTEIVNVGAAAIDGPPPYQAMLSAGLCRVTGLDPQGGPPVPWAAGEQHFPVCVGAAGPRCLNVGKLAGMTSIKSLNPKTISTFSGMESLAETARFEDVDVVPLDDISEVGPIDFLCMDAQGSELEILASGRGKLENVVAVLTEVSFVPLYKGQPTFGEMDLALRARGLIPHCFVAAKCWPIATGVKVAAKPQQLLEADIAYVRDFSSDMAPEQWKHLAMIAHHVFGSFDLAMRCVERLAALDAVAPTAPLSYRQLIHGFE